VKWKKWRRGDRLQPWCSLQSSSRKLHQQDLWRPLLPASLCEQTQYHIRWRNQSH